MFYEVLNSFSLCNMNLLLPFHLDCDIIGEKAGVHFVYTVEGKTDGVVFLDLASEEDVQRAMAKVHQECRIWPSWDIGPSTSRKNSHLC